MRHIGTMELAHCDNAELTSVLRAMLSRPPVVTGVRLRSERELAEILKVGRKRVRVLLEDLVAEGVLVRRHGSGTYVRRVPIRSIDDLISDAESLPQKWALRPESIIAPDDGRPTDVTRLKPAPHQRRLRLEIWSGFHKTSPTNRTILNAMLDRAEQVGHDLSVHSIIRQADQPLQEDELVQRLQAQPGDGYLVSAFLGPLFRRAFRKAFGSTQPSAVYVAPGSAPVDCEPLIRIDTDEAIVRALSIFKSEGYERIGILTVKNPMRGAMTEEAFYNWNCGLIGQTYRAVAEEPRTVEGGYHGTLQLLDQADRPDAIYVSNDELLPGVLAALKERGVEPGADIGVITLSTTSDALPTDYRWSQLQFDPQIVGHDAVDAILRLIQTAGRRLNSQSYLARWIPGQTHRRP